MHLRDRSPLVEQAVGERAEIEAVPRLRQGVSLAQAAAEDPARLGVREVDDEILVDREHSLVQPFEQEPQPVALGLDAAEGAAQLPAHPVEVVCKQTELVPEAVAQRGLEVAVRDALGGSTQPAEAEGDELREEQSDDHADHARDDPRPERLAVDRVDRLGRGRLRADRHEHLAVIRDRRYERPAVGGSLDDVLAGGGVADGLAHESGSAGGGARRREELEADVSLQLPRHAVEGRRRDVLAGSRLRVVEREALAMAAKRDLGAVRELGDDDRRRGRGHDGERDPEPPANSDEGPRHGSIVGFPACRKGIRCIGRPSGCRFSWASVSRSRRRIRAPR